jgi:hypothetical protein
MEGSKLKADFEKPSRESIPTLFLPIPGNMFKKTNIATKYRTELFIVQLEIKAAHLIPVKPYKVQKPNKT